MQMMPKLTSHLTVLLPLPLLLHVARCMPATPKRLELPLPLLPLPVLHLGHVLYYKVHSGYQLNACCCRGTG